MSLATEHDARAAMRRLADARLDRHRREDEAHAFFRPDGLPLICFPMRRTDGG